MLRTEIIIYNRNQLDQWIRVSLNLCVLSYEDGVDVSTVCP